MIGTLAIKSGNKYGFIKHDGESIFIHKRDFFTAVNGDTVEFKKFGKRKSGRNLNPEGYIVNIIKRGVSKIKGRIIQVSEVKTIIKSIELNMDFEVKGAKKNVGRVAICDIVTYSPPLAVITKIVEEVITTDGIIEDMLILGGIENNFPDDVMSETKEILRLADIEIKSYMK